MLTELERWKRQTTSTGDLIDYIDLRSFGSETRLEQRLFHSDIFASWLSGRQSLHLFIDSLDEALLRIDTLAALLGEELRKYPVERLSLRIACRTAVWPDLLDESSLRCGQSTSSRYMNLLLSGALTLRVQLMLTALIQPNSLKRSLGPKPRHSRSFRLPSICSSTSYRREGELPKDRWELYERGTTLLADETSLSRRASRLTGKLTARQRLAVASRVAALTIFANRFAVWTEPDRGDVPAEDLTKPELAGGQETVDGNPSRSSHTKSRKP